MVRYCTISGEKISPWRPRYFQWPRLSKTKQLQHYRANPAGGRSRSNRKMQQQMIEELATVAASNDTSEAITQLSSAVTQPHTSTPSNAVTNGSLASTAMPWTSLKGSCSSDASNQEVPLAVKRETDGTTISTTVSQPGDSLIILESMSNSKGSNSISP